MGGGRGRGSEGVGAHTPDSLNSLSIHYGSIS